MTKSAIITSSNVNPRSFAIPPRSMTIPPSNFVIPRLDRGIQSKVRSASAIV
jgi:hypothetical protein